MIFNSIKTFTEYIKSLCKGTINVNNRLFLTKILINIASTNIKNSYTLNIISKYQILGILVYNLFFHFCFIILNYQNLKVSPFIGINSMIKSKYHFRYLSIFTNEKATFVKLLTLTKTKFVLCFIWQNDLSPKSMNGRVFLFLTKIFIRKYVRKTHSIQSEI